MTEIKICGLTRLIDIEMVNRCKPEYIGFVFAKSRRRVTPEEAQLLSEKLDDTIRTVGVFVEEEPEAIAEIAASCRLSAVQVHGDVEAAYEKEVRKAMTKAWREKRMTSAAPELWRAIRVRTKQDFELLAYSCADAFLFDSYSPGSHGGTGECFDWKLANGVGSNHRIILAGGLTAENVTQAIRQVNPFAVDVSSGVETDGFKDAEKIAAFMDAVRGAAPQA